VPTSAIFIAGMHINLRRTEFKGFRSSPLCRVAAPARMKSRVFLWPHLPIPNPQPLFSEKRKGNASYLFLEPLFLLIFLFALPLFLSCDRRLGSIWRFAEERKAIKKVRNRPATTRERACAKMKFFFYLRGIPQVDPHSALPRAPLLAADVRRMAKNPKGAPHSEARNNVKLDNAGPEELL
jgi:hypothetical protein